MCEIITTIMAIAFSVAYFSFKKSNKNQILIKTTKTTTLLFWGASLMWLVDCVRNAIEGEAFFDLSKEDLTLGIYIALVGFSIFLFSTVILLSKEKLWIKSK